MPVTFPGPERGPEIRFPFLGLLPFFFAALFLFFAIFFI
jgi:hypothetical protein